MKQNIIEFLEGEQYSFLRIEREFPEISGLRAVLQNPIFHGEGNVWEHTRRVCDALISFPEWQELKREEKGILYLAALFHDIGKKRCTKLEDGKIISPRHAIMGAKMFRESWYLNYSVKFEISFSVREEAAFLIRFHGLPLLFLEKKEIDRELLRARECVRFSLLYLLGKADGEGRICENQMQVKQTMEYFKEYAKEIECFEEKVSFANLFTRWRYFKGGNVWREQELFDETEFPVYLMMGLPLSGKDTYIEQNLSEIPMVSLDVLREEMKILPTESSAPVVARAKEMAKGYLRKKQAFVWNATNITFDIRTRIEGLCEKYGARVILIYLEAPYEELLKRNEIRERKVPAVVIENMIHKMDMPEPIECYQVLKMEGITF